MNMAAENDELASTTLADARWKSVVARDSNADGTFYYSVKTTGVYCRPSCAARLPRRENVRFFSSRAEAEGAGFRPCKRCKPDQPRESERNAEKVAAVCRLIQTSEEPLSLRKLSETAGMSTYHFHRVFKSITGLTPKAFAAEDRAARMRTNLNSGGSITSAIYDAGYNSNARFYERSDRELGMTPTAYRDGGKGAAIRFSVGECSLGSILVAASDRGVCAILLGGDAESLVRDLQDRFPKANLIGGDPAFDLFVSKVVGFVEAPEMGLDLPLDIRGTAFQQRVWRALQQIPVGSTVTYTDIANRIGTPRSARAVAQACGANPLAVVIPCHRVVRSDGDLSGYRWGIERKSALLQRESTRS